MNYVHILFEGISDALNIKKNELHKMPVDVQIDDLYAWYGELLKIVEAKYSELCNEILDKKIDIYQRWKVWALYRYMPEGDKTLIHNYMKGIVNENNIFRILGDMISESTGTMGYGYSMNENYLESLFGEKDILKRVIC